jgi:hypothetical protein
VGTDVKAHRLADEAATAAAPADGPVPGGGIRTDEVTR